MANVSVGEHYENLVDSLVESGRYNSRSEVFRSGLRLLEEQEELRKLRLEKLSSEIQKGVESGSSEFDPQEIKALARKKLEAKKRGA
jgi:antitoxin ParD1/3/4